MVSHKAGDGVELHPAALNIALPAPTVVVLDVTHHVAVVTETFLTTFALERFVQARLFSGSLTNEISRLINISQGLL